jgi:parallel beta-helix repeat protein
MRFGGAMYSQFRSFIVVAVVSMFAVSAISALVVFQREVSAYTPRGRILINGNGDFTQANGVTQGSGTSSDPYIIEGWEIDLMMESGNGIDIRNTDAHFIIRDVSVSRGMMHYDGIFFYNVSYGNVENAELSKNNRGVCLSNSTDVAVVRSVISSHVGESIYISQTQNVSVNSNTVFASRYAIYLFNSTNVEITANKISNKRATVLAHYSNNITLFANDFSYDGGGGGIFFEYMDNVTIAFNNISDSDWFLPPIS